MIKSLDSKCYGFRKFLLMLIPKTKFKVEKLFYRNKLGIYLE